MALADHCAERAHLGGLSFGGGLAIGHYVDLAAPACFDTESRRFLGAIEH